MMALRILVHFLFFLCSGDSSSFDHDGEGERERELVGMNQCKIRQDDSMSGIFRA